MKAAHLAALAEVSRLSQAEVYEVASFYHHLDIVRESDVAPAPLTIGICDWLSCEMAGAADIITATKDTAASSFDPYSSSALHWPM